MMTWMRRAALFQAVNLPVVLTISIVLQLLGIGPYRIKALRTGPA